MTSADLSAEAGMGGTLPGETLGRYRLMKKIARGGMAEVFAARSFGAHGFEKTVAIKRILPRYGEDPQFIRMMVDEAKITVLLNHPNVATILELCEQDDDYFIVMEFVPGQSLSAVVRKMRERNEQFAALEACFIVVELLQGLHAAHVQKDASGKPAHIIHRDVSPQNVLLSFDGHVKVIDFGIARARHRLEMTEVGTIKGKLRYLAPEMIDPARFMKTGDFDHRVDVFAAAIVLWELIANRTLYPGDDEMAVYDAITDTDAPDLGKLGLSDQALAKIVAKGLSRDPEKRHLTAEDFADALRAHVYRSDPAFTPKRILTAMARAFPAEKEEMAALERGQTGTGVAALSTSNASPLPPPPSLREPSAREPSVKNQPAREPSAKSAPSAKEPSASVKQARRSHGDVDPVAPSAATRTLHQQAPADPTRAMRSGDSSKKLRGNPPGQGDVLTTMTLVSRVNGTPRRSAQERAPPDTPEERAALTELEAAANDFGAGASTVTITHDNKDKHEPGDVDNETPSTPGKPRRGPASGATIARARFSRPPMILLSIASVVGIASIAIVADLLSRPPDEVAPPQPVIKHAPDAVKVLVSSSAPGATASLPGSNESMPVPATFPAYAGDSLEIVVKAPGYLERSMRVSIPQHGAADQPLDVPLSPAPVPIKLDVVPPDATVLVDEQPYTAGMFVDAGKPHMLQVSAPGYAAIKKEIDVAVGVAVSESIELKPEPSEAPLEIAKAKVPSEVAPKSEKHVDKGPVKNASLKIMTKEMWGQVTIDGKSYDETPLTVELKPGRHTVVVSHPPKSKTFTITLKPGESAVKTVSFE
ncbi:MAG TPA: protein kinase [Myxococcota bacterium]